MDKPVTWLLLTLVVIGAIGVWLYAHELSRQADERRTAVIAAKQAEIEDAIHQLSGPIATFCQPEDKTVIAANNAKIGSPEWLKWQCNFATTKRDELHEDVDRVERGQSWGELSDFDRTEIQTSRRMEVLYRQWKEESEK
jgi:hypothetical protein